MVLHRDAPQVPRRIRDEIPLTAGVPLRGIMPLRVIQDRVETDPRHRHACLLRQKHLVHHLPEPRTPTISHSPMASPMQPDPLTGFPSVQDLPDPELRGHHPHQAPRQRFGHR
jgi:hypothetical protein